MATMTSEINFIKSYWGLNFPPFDNVPNPDLFYPSTIHREGLIRIYYAIIGSKGAAMLTGDIGSGKTTLSRFLIKNLPKAKYEFALINNPDSTKASILREINYQLDIENSSSDRMELLHRLNDRLLKNFKAGKETIIMVDEAQAIEDTAVFEELRLLLNFQLNDKFLLTLILIGQPKLQEIISRIKQLDQRIAIKYHLGAFGFNDTIKYILYRLKKCNSASQIFTEDVFKLIYKYTKGVPRLINNLCDLCLLSGYLTKTKVIDSKIVESIITDGVYQNCV